MAFALVLGGGLAFAATITGTGEDEVLIGTSFADDIRAKGGADMVRGLGGPDMINGGRGRDQLYGGPGADNIDSVDLRSQAGGYRDFVDCGGGRDFASVDNTDRYQNCEEVSFTIP